MAGPTFSLVAHVVDENGAAPTGSYTWQINYWSWLTDVLYPSGGRVTPQQSTTGTATCAPLVIGTTERDQIYGFTTAYAGQFNPAGVYTDVGFCNLVLHKVGGSPAAGTITNIAGTITAQGGATFPFAAALYWNTYGAPMVLMSFWANGSNRPVPVGTSGAVARVETGQQHTAALKALVQSVVGPTPVPQATQFVFATTFDSGFDFDLDTYRRGFETLRHMGFNCPIPINKPEAGYSNQTPQHRQAQLDAGLPSWAASNYARPPGNGFEWKDWSSGDVGVGGPTSSGYLAWAQEVYNRHVAAGYAPADLKLIVMYDEPSWFYPWEVEVANLGTATVETPHPQAGYTETGDVAVAQARFQAYVQTLVDASGNPYVPADFGGAAWTDIHLTGIDKQAGTLQERRRFAATARFLPWHFADLVGQRGRSSLLAKFGVPVPVGFDMNNFVGRSVSRGQSPAGGQWSQQHPTNTMGLGAPDWFYTGRRGCDFAASDGWFGDYFAWTWSFRSSIFRMTQEPSNLLIPMYSGRLDGMYQQLLACAVHGAKKWQVYQMSPEYVRPSETMGERAYNTANGNVSGLSGAMKVLAQTEDLSGPGRPLTGRKVAILFSRPSQAFDAFGNFEIQDSLNGNIRGLSVDWVLDQIGFFEALALHMGVPVDWLDDEDVIAGNLNAYDLLYVAGPNVSGRAGSLITAWVNAGGKLVTSVGAGRYDWDNEPLAAPLCNLGGLTETPRARVAVTNIFTLNVAGGVPDGTKLVDIYTTADSSRVTTLVGATTAAADMRTGLSGAASGNVVARYADDNSVALVDVPVGSGRHLHWTCPAGMAYSYNGGQPTGDALPPYSDPKVVVHRDLLVTRPLSYSTYKRPVEVDQPMYECGVLTSAGGWAIVVLNWTGAASGTRNFRIRPPFTPTSVKLPDGSTVAVTTTSDGFTFSAPVGSGTVLRVYGAAPVTTSTESWGALPL
jgi:hypothetical protein